MYEFQIHDKEGKAIALNTLDKIVADFWGVPVEENRYASPVKRLIKPESFASDDEHRNWSSMQLNNSRDRIMLNWHDVIGCFVIGRGASTWDAVREKFIEPYEKALKKYEDAADYQKMRDMWMTSVDIAPFLNLIEHFRSLGYAPVPVKL